MSWGKRRRIGFPAHRSRASLGFSFLVSPCRLVERLVPYRRCGVRSWRVSGLVVLLGSISSWMRRHSFILRRGGVLALILRLSSRPLLVPPSRGASRCSFPHVLRAGAAGSAYSSHRGRSSRAAWRGVRSRPVRCLVLVSSWRLVGVSSSVICPLRWRCMLAAPRGCVSSLVSWSGEASASRIIPDGSGLAAVLVLPSRGRCLLALMPSGDRDNVVLVIGVPACSLSVLWLRGVRPCGVPHLARRRLLLAPGAVAFASCRLSDLKRTGREAWRRLLAWISSCGLSCLVD